MDSHRDMALRPYGSWVKRGTSLISLNTGKMREHLSAPIQAHISQTLHSLLIISLKTTSLINLK